MLRLALALGLGLAFAAPAFAQGRDETLADIRQQLSALFLEVQNLRRELSTTGASQSAPGGGSVLDRVNAAESELQRLTAKSEELENRINRIVTDGTNRLGDLEFRLCELETGCDVGQLGNASTLGGGALPQAGAGGAVQPPSDGGGSLAVGERADFDRAKAAFDAGDFGGAAGLFQSFTQTYTAGPLYGEALYWRGEALSRTGDTPGAARAFLDSFFGAPGNAMAPRALLRLGQSLGELGQLQEACVTLTEVTARYPGNPAVAEAETSRRSLGCQ
jgi:tol-pal system protein YbgF